MLEQEITGILSLDFPHICIEKFLYHKKCVKTFFLDPTVARALLLHNICPKTKCAPAQKQDSRNEDVCYNVDLSNNEQS